MGKLRGKTNEPRQGRQKWLTPAREGSVAPAGARNGIECCSRSHGLRHGPHSIGPDGPPPIRDAHLDGELIASGSGSVGAVSPPASPTRARIPTRVGTPAPQASSRVAAVEGQGAGEHTLDGARPEENVPSGSQTPKVGCLRQPANLHHRGTEAQRKTGGCSAPQAARADGRADRRTPLLI
jgi:hypothetical protein